MSDSVGPYTLEEQLGQGGMGVVFKATHAPTGLPVALKMMRAEPISTRAHSVFLNEIHQASKLSHPNIAAIFDYGETSDEDAAKSAKRIRPHQPYIVMELSRRGSLDMLADVLSWRDLHGIVQSLLAALGHAHARGILHRDIKPGNILLGSDEDLRPSIKLADFGLALTHSEVIAPNTGLRVVGTPEYMAPEQIEGLWRDQGPWTDLYALGCVAFELASGWPPFSGDSPREIALGHLSSPPPPLRPMSVLPDAFEGWLSRMLAKEPADRFQCAADAAYALSQVHLEADADTPVFGSKKPHAASPTWTFMDIDLPRRAATGEESGPAVHPGDAPPLVEDWRNVQMSPGLFKMTGASLSLVGIKPTQLVGRAPERDALRSNLFEVARSGYPRAEILKGTAGLGKRRLANWIAQTAHEAGMANNMVARHSSLRSPADGLPRMFADFLHTRDLSGGAVLQRTDAVLKQHGVTDTYDLSAFARILLAASGAVNNPDTVPAASLTETLALFERILQQLTEHRPVILHISDAQWATEALQFCIRLLADRPRPLPVLIVVTCDTEHIQLRPQEARHLERLCDSPLSQTLQISPLPIEEAQSLIETMLQIETRLSRRICEQSAGSPVFAIQLVEDLVERGLLEPGPSGFKLKSGVSLTLPSSIDALWTDRLTACLADLPATATEAVQAAAALGVYVDENDWTAVCKALQIDIPDTLLSRLARSNLIDIDDGGWSFTHVLLRRSIESHAGERWGAINLAAANMLAGQAPRAGVAHRIGQHLTAAGEHEDALPYLMQGAIEGWRQGSLFEALNLLDAHQDAMMHLELPHSDARWGAQWIERVLVEHNLRRFDLALPLSIKVCDAALKNGWTALQARAFRYRGMVATAHNEHSEADAMFARAESLVGSHELREKAAIHRHWGMMLRRVGRTEDSLRRLEQAADAYRRQNQLQDLAWTYFHLAEVHNVMLADHGRAQTMLEEAKKLFEVQKDTMGIADCANGLAEIHRAMGNLANAEAAYSESEISFRRAGVDTAIVPLLNRGLLQLERGQYTPAEALLEEVMSTLRGGSWLALMPFVHAGLLVINGARASWDEWDAHEDALRTSLERTPMVERDLASPLERAGDLAHLEGKVERAQRAWGIALNQWRSLGDQAAIERLSRRLNSTSS